MCRLVIIESLVVATCMVGFLYGSRLLFCFLFLLKCDFWLWLQCVCDDGKRIRFITASRE